MANLPLPLIYLLFLWERMLAESTLLTFFSYIARELE
jgi:hypothetical protein